MDKLFDNHNHSEFSFDGGRTSVLKTSRQAAAKKLGGICFTDHCDFFVPPMKAEHEHLSGSIDFGSRMLVLISPFTFN